VAQLGPDFLPLGVVADHPPFDAVIKLPVDKAGSTLSSKGMHKRMIFKNGADIPRPTMRNSFVLVQWHGESSVRETSLMI
jgi:hypothetical protein